jgi:hypothetical protein
MAMIKFTLKFPLAKVQEYASRYAYTGAVEEETLMNRKSMIMKRGYLIKSELTEICMWKTHRSKSRVAGNSDEFVKEVSSVAFSTKNDQLRIEVLTLLQGLSWPSASVILHFYHKERFPIIDFRALYSVGCENVNPAQYDFDFWQQYTEETRRLAVAAGVNMRVLDRALWQYSNEYQTKNKVFEKAN